MTDIDGMLKSAFGVGLTLDEWKKKYENAKYTEYTDVKTLKFPKKWGFKPPIVRNIPTLIVLEKGDWCPKYGGAWGTSGVSGTGSRKKENAPKSPVGGVGLHNLKLTNEEIISVLEQYDSYQKGLVVFKTVSVGGTSTTYNKDGSSVTIKDPPCQELETYSRGNEMWDCYNGLKGFADRKFRENIKSNKITYHINGKPISYTEIITETTSETRVNISPAFYLFDEEGKFIRAFNYGAIYG